MNKTILLIAICLSGAVTTKAETKVEREVKQLILDDNAYALKNLKDKAKTISEKGSLEFWSSGGLLQSLQQNAKVREFDTYNLHPKHAPWHYLASLAGGVVSLCAQLPIGEVAPSVDDKAEGYTSSFYLLNTCF